MREKPSKRTKKEQRLLKQKIEQEEEVCVEFHSCFLRFDCFNCFFLSFFVFLIHTTTILFTPPSFIHSTHFHPFTPSHHPHHRYLSSQPPSFFTTTATIPHNHRSTNYPIYSAPPSFFHTTIHPHHHHPSSLPPSFQTTIIHSLHHHLSTPPPFFHTTIIHPHHHHHSTPPPSFHISTIIPHLHNHSTFPQSPFHTTTIHPHHHHPSTPPPSIHTTTIPPQNDKILYGKVVGSAYEMDDFSSMELSRPLMRALSHLGWSKPTPIQSSTIPVALMGTDICACAATGTGEWVDGVCVGGLVVYA